MALQTANQFQLQPNVVQAGLGGFQAGTQLRGQEDERTRQAQFRQLAGVMTDPMATAEQKMQAQSQLSGIAPEQSLAIQNKVKESLSEQDLSNVTEIARSSVQISAIPTPEGRLQAAKNKKQEFIKRGIDPAPADRLISALESGDNALAQQMLDKGIEAGQILGVLETGGRAGDGLSSEQRTFEALTKDLSEQDKKQATLIKLGLEPRAVGSAIQTISGKGLEKEIGDASAIIKQREKFGELTGSSRAKTIDKGFEQVNRIGQNINTIDRAISALEGGAKTGALEQFLPSMRAASVELENIRNQFALDVIGGVTLGAISESELDLAKQVGLPSGLDESELIKHLQARKAAQEKLRDYYREQIDHLDSGGTVASFLRMKEKQLGAQGGETPEPAAPAPTPTPAPTTPAPRFLGFE